MIKRENIEKCENRITLNCSWIEEGTSSDPGFKIENF